MEYRFVGVSKPLGLFVVFLEQSAHAESSYDGSISGSEFRNFHSKAAKFGVVRQGLLYPTVAVEVPNFVREVCSFFLLKLMVFRLRTGTKIISITVVELTSPMISI